MECSTRQTVGQLCENCGASDVALYLYLTHVEYKCSSCHWEWLPPKGTRYRKPLYGRMLVNTDGEAVAKALEANEGPCPVCEEQDWQYVASPPPLDMKCKGCGLLVVTRHLHHWVRSSENEVVCRRCGILFSELE